MGKDKIYMSLVWVSIHCESKNEEQILQAVEAMERR